MHTLYLKGPISRSVLAKKQLCILSYPFVGKAHLITQGHNIIKLFAAVIYKVSEKVLWRAVSTICSYNKNH
jgi:hypothetical protein